MSIKFKILIPMIILTVIAALLVLVSNILQFSNYYDSVIGDRVEAAWSVAENKLEDLKESASVASLYFAGDPELIKAVASGDRTAILEQANRLQKNTDVEFCTITQEDGTVLVRTHEPDNYNDSVASQANVKSAMNGTAFTALEKGSAVKLSVRSGAPIKNEAGKVIGVVSAGYRLDTIDFVDSVKNLMGCEATVFIGDERISTTMKKDDGSRAIGTKIAEEISREVLGGSIYTGIAPIMGKDAMTKYSPIRGIDGDIIGMLFVGRFIDEKDSTVAGFLTTGLLIILALLFIAIPAIIFIVQRIIKPVKAIVGAAHALAEGDVDVDIRVNTKDEMRDLADAFNRIISNTRIQSQAIGAIADGDLTVEIKSKSEKDVIGNALKYMVGLNNDVFSQIVGSAKSVSSGARQIADSSQFLAQGATEQATAVEQLSADIGDVDVKSRDNETMAGQAAGLSDIIMKDLKASSEQMARMVKAVNEINEANQAINKIIKVIDDIAFQTNILALNASVEAARAGQQGKGFAVVAEEVRNLAEKSAGAAKDTSALIENSISKAMLGVGIAAETAASLGEITKIINESSQLVEKIADASAHQTSSIEQIKLGINRVAQVVQQNSATAEQSAASSQEMNRQAEILENLVAQFRLKETAAERGAARLDSGDKRKRLAAGGVTF